MKANIIKRIYWKLTGSYLLRKEKVTFISSDDIREKWIVERLKKLPAGFNVLDAGAGEQKYRQYCNHLIYTSQDFAQYSGDGDKGAHTGKWDYGKLDIISDIISIPAPDESFDAILCSEVLEHIPNPHKVFPEFSRLLKKEGCLIITAPFNSFTHFDPYHYCTGFNKAFYQEHLAVNGFEIVEMIENGGFYDYMAQQLKWIDWSAHKYSSVDLLPWEVKSIQNVLLCLDRLKQTDKGSEEFANNGIFVVAKKIK